MSAVARLYRAEHVHPGKIRPREGAVVDNFGHVCTCRGEDAGKVCETAGAIRDQSVETVNTPIRSKPPLDHPAVCEWVNVAAGGPKADPFANKVRKRSSENLRKPRSTCAFDDAFIQLSQAQNGECQRLFVDGYQAINQCPADGESQTSRLGHCQPIGQREFGADTNGFSCLQPRGKTSGICCLHPNDLQVRFERLEHSRNTGQQTSPTDRNDNRFSIWNLFKNLKRERTLTRDDTRVVVRMDIMKSAFLGQTLRLSSSLLETVPVQYNGCAKLPASRSFYQRSEARHDDGNRDAKQMSVPCQPQCVVPCRSRDHSEICPLGRQLGKSVTGTTLFEAASALELFLFAEDSRTGQFTQ